MPCRHRVIAPILREDGEHAVAVRSQLVLDQGPRFISRYRPHDAQNILVGIATSRSGRKIGPIDTNFYTSAYWF